MMRVEVNMDDSIRGLIAKYADETNMTMPSAYRELMVYGLLVSEVEYPTFKPDVDINEDAIRIAKMNEDEYELTIKESPEPADD